MVKLFEKFGDALEKSFDGIGNTIDKVFDIIAPASKALSDAINNTQVDNENSAALNILHPQLSFNSAYGVEIGRNNATTIASDRKVIQRYREWLVSQPTNVKNAYEHWLSHTERGCNDAERAIVDGLREKYLEADKIFWNELDAKTERIKNMNFPHP